MSKLLKINVLCGGQSTEHEVSLLSAANVIAALDPKRYEVSVTYVTHKGDWHFIMDANRLLKEAPIELINSGQADQVALIPGDQVPLYSLASKNHYKVDCFFPVMHGTNCEDGVLQGLLTALNIPFVGTHVLGSAICMAKNITKALLAGAGLPVTPWRVVKKGEQSSALYQEVKQQFGNHLFVKPVSLGSSVGIHKVTSSSEFITAVDDAFQYDHQLLVEPAIIGREIECAILGNEKPVASLPGEIITRHNFYSYDAKYGDPHATQTFAPAKLDSVIVKKVQELSIAAFHVLQCCGMLRVDFFITEDGILINEANTIPGFTNISMYPKMWQASGISYSELVNKLIALALERQCSDALLEKAYPQKIPARIKD